MKSNEDVAVKITDREEEGLFLRGVYGYPKFLTAGQRSRTAGQGVTLGCAHK